METNFLNVVVITCVTMILKPIVVGQNHSVTTAGMDWILAQTKQEIPLMTAGELTRFSVRRDRYSDGISVNRSSRTIVPTHSMFPYSYAGWLKIKAALEAWIYLMLREA